MENLNKENQQPTPKSFNLKVMHWINRIAITVFILGILWKLLEWFVLK